MATPASRFFPIPEAERAILPLRLPPELSSVEPPAETTGHEIPISEPTGQLFASLDVVEIDRVVPPSGNLGVAGQQFWLGRHLVGAVVCLWMDTTTVHLSVGGRRLKTVPSRLSANQLAKLRLDGGRSAGPPPAAPPTVGQGGAIEVDRSVNAVGLVSLGRPRSASASSTQDAGSPCGSKKI